MLQRVLWRLQIAWYRFNLRLLSHEVLRINREKIDALADYEDADYRALKAYEAETLREMRRLHARISELTHLRKGSIT